MIKVDLGCGVNKPIGYIGIDCITKADIQHDLSQGIPLADNKVDELRAKDFLEHIPNTVKIFNECWRVLRPKGVFEIEVPRFPHVDAIKDPTHIRFFAVETFTEYFAGPDRLAEEYNMRMWDIIKLNYDERRIWVTLGPRKL